MSKGRRRRNIKEELRGILSEQGLSHHLSPLLFFSLVYEIGEARDAAKVFVKMTQQNQHHHHRGRHPPTLSPYGLYNMLNKTNTNKTIVDSLAPSQEALIMNKSLGML